METVVKARLLYPHLDEADCPVRLRLNSTVVRVEHDGPAEKSDWVKVAYVSEGKVHGVRARNAVLACYNSIVRFLMPNFPRSRRKPSRKRRKCRFSTPTSLSGTGSPSRSSASPA